MTAILELQNIRLSLTNSRGERYELLRGVNLAVEKGGVTALVGGNGTGKTTLFNIISGFQPAYRGDIRFDGQLLNRMPAHRISQRGIGRLFQGGQLGGAHLDGKYENGFQRQVRRSAVLGVWTASPIS